MAKISPVIYLDMDGVCVDFVSASIRASGQSPADIFEKWDRDFKAEFYTEKIMGISREAFWEAIDREGEAFWAGLKEYPWFKPLYQALTDLAPVIFLSSPSTSPACLSGKLKWLQDRFGLAFRDFIFTSHKQQVAAQGAILVDDYEANVARFQAAGGQAVLFPQLWNSNYPIEDKLGYTIAQVKDLYNRIYEVTSL